MGGAELVMDSVLVGFVMAGCWMVERDDGPCDEMGSALSGNMGDTTLGLPRLGVVLRALLGT